MAAVTRPAEIEETRSDEVVRFSRWVRLEHVTVITLFVLLLVTGLPQKWPFAASSQWLIDAMGGIFSTRWLHRAAGLAFVVFTFVHLGRVIFGVVSRRLKPTMMFERKDVTDVVQNLRYYLGSRDEPPRFGRYDYRQKFEYWGLVMGGLVMVFSGLVLLYPIVVARLLPPELIPAAKEMHTNEALLALLTIICWHMYGAHLNPDVFPFDKSIFTGRMSRHHLAQMHPLEYEELFGRPAEEELHHHDDGDDRDRPRPVPVEEGDRGRDEGSG